jgi:3-isopropylmalate/(R)-2-methylmalate dehydratase small subunit
MNLSRITAVSGRALPLRGHDIDTDRIIPARFLRSVTFDGLEQYVFVDERAGSSAAARAHGVHPFDDPHFQGASVLLVNSNFGCGSSREHAPQALQRWGIRAVVGESFSEIFFGNSLALGMPCVSASPEDVRRIMDAVEQDPSLTLDVDVRGLTVAFGETRAGLTMPRAARDAFLDGSWDATGLLLQRFEEVEAVAERLPYAGGWTTRS